MANFFCSFGDAAQHRATLGQYSAGYLRYVWAVSSAVAIAAYSLWAFEKGGAAGGTLWFQLSIVPLASA